MVQVLWWQVLVGIWFGIGTASGKVGTGIEDTDVVLPILLMWYIVCAGSMVVLVAIAAVAIGSGTI